MRGDAVKTVSFGSELNCLSCKVLGHFKIEQHLRLANGVKKIRLLNYKDQTHSRPYT